MAPTPVDLGEPQRQSLWAVAFLALRTVRQVGVVQLVLILGFVVARLPSVVAFLGLAMLVGLVLFLVAALQWWRYTFHITGDDLVVRRGILEQQTLTISLDRIQSVSLEQKLLHRIVSLVQVEVDTAGTQTAEFVIDAVDRSVAEALQRVAASHQRSRERPDTPADTPPPPEEVLIRHDARRIAKVALTQTPFAGLVLIAPIFAVADEIGTVIEWLPFELPRIENADAGAWLLWFIPLALIVGLVLSIVLNLIRVFLTDWNLTVHSTAAGLRRDAGLLSTTSVAATLPRVQVVSTTQGLLQRAASLQAVKLATIGSANLMIPGCTHTEAQVLRALVLGDIDDALQVDQRVSQQEVFLVTRNTAVLAVLGAVALSFAIGWWALLVLLLVPPVALASRRSVKLRRWGLNEEALASYHELAGWRRDEVLLRKVNGITVRQSLFERKRDLATVRFDTAAGAVSIGMIPHTDAQRLRDLALFTVETDRRSWM